MASYDKRGSREEHITEMQTREKDKEGSASREAELNFIDLDKLKKVFIFPVKDLPLKLKKAWKVCYNMYVYIWYSTAYILPYSFFYFLLSAL